MLGEQIDLRAGLELMTRQLNALEAAGPVLQAAESRERAVYLAEVKKAEAAKGAIQFPAPSRSGLVPARGLVQVGAGGTYTLTGNGGAGIGGAGDNGVFAAAAATSSLGTFTCRLVSVRPAKGVAATDLANGAVVGLMARDNLTPTAASLGVEFVLDRGLNFHERALDGDPLFARNRAGSWPGLLSQAAVQTANAGPSGNLLLKPVWFRLVLDVNKWMPFTSLDGYSWTAAGAPTPVEFAGCWVGLFASSNTAGKALIAVFDNVTGFRPDTFAQLGTP
jgi:hypothetical protein